MKFSVDMSSVCPVNIKQERDLFQRISENTQISKSSLVAWELSEKLRIVLQLIKVHSVVDKKCWSRKKWRCISTIYNLLFRHSIRMLPYLGNILMVNLVDIFFFFGGKTSQNTLIQLENLSSYLNHREVKA